MAKILPLFGKGEEDIASRTGPVHERQVSIADICSVISGQKPDWERIIDVYRGNPLYWQGALKMPEDFIGFFGRIHVYNCLEDLASQSPGLELSPAIKTDTGSGRYIPLFYDGCHRPFILGPDDQGRFGVDNTIHADRIIGTADGCLLALNVRIGRYNDCIKESLDHDSMENFLRILASSDPRPKKVVYGVVVPNQVSKFNDDSISPFRHRGGTVIPIRDDYHRFRKQANDSARKYGLENLR